LSFCLFSSVTTVFSAAASNASIDILGFAIEHTSSRISLAQFSFFI
jgi:hypothetical protein